jgi:hypothetical protein
MDKLADWIGRILCDGLAKPLRSFIGSDAGCAFLNPIIGLHHSLADFAFSYAHFHESILNG